MVLDIYVDGSYSKVTPNITKGGIVIVDSKTKEVISIRHVKSENPSFTKANNAGGEVIASMVGIMDAAFICKGEKSILNIFYDYRGVKDFITGAYTANAEGMVMYVHAVNKILVDNPNVELKFFKVKAHSGDKFNDMADLVAKGNIPDGYRHLMKQTIDI